MIFQSDCTGDKDDGGTELEPQWLPRRQPSCYQGGSWGQPVSPSHESPISLHSLPHRVVEMKKNMMQHIAEEEEEEIHSLGCFSTMVLGELGLLFLLLGEEGTQKGGEIVVLLALAEKGFFHLLVRKQAWMEREEVTLSARMVLGKMGWFPSPWVVVLGEMDWCPSLWMVVLEKRGLSLFQTGDWEGTGVVNLGCRCCCSCSSVRKMIPRTSEDLKSEGWFVGLVF